MYAWSRAWVVLALVAGCGGPGADADAGPSGDAAAGDGGVTSDGGVPSAARITAAEGGMLQSPDGALTLVVPPGALASDTDLSITIVPRDAWPAEIEATEPIGEVYDLQPDGLAFLTPAFAVARWDAIPSELTTSEGASVFGVHHARSADGTIEAVDTRTALETDGGVTVIGALAHLSQHWTSGRLGARRFAADFTCDAGEHQVGAEWACTRAQVYADGAATADVATFSEVHWNTGESTGVVPAVASPAETETGTQRYLPGTQHDLAIAAEQSIDFALGNAPHVTPLPAWRCDSIDRTGHTRVLAGARLTLAGGPRLALVHEWGPATCVEAPPPGPRRYGTVPHPEGVRLFNVGSRTGPAASEVPTLATNGLLEGLWAAIAGGDGQLDLVHLETGTRRTNGFTGAAYGVVPAQTAPGANGVSFIEYGPGGTQEIAWSELAGDFGFTALGGGGNTTDVVVADVDGDGFTEAQLITGNGASLITYRDGGAGGSTLVTGSVFPGGSFPSAPISAAFGVGFGEIVVVLENGEVWTGPMSGPLELVGNAGTEPRQMQCTEGTDPIVCAIAGYGDDSVYVVELDASGGRIAASAPACDAPVEPAVRATPTGATIAVPCSGDSGLRVFDFDAATDALTDVVPGATIASCASPNHCAWIGATDVLCTCYGDGAAVRLPLSAI